MGGGNGDFFPFIFFQREHILKIMIRSKSIRSIKMGTRVLIQHNMFIICLVFDCIQIRNLMGVGHKTLPIKNVSLELDCIWNFVFLCTELDHKYMQAQVLAFSRHGHPPQGHRQRYLQRQLIRCRLQLQSLHMEEHHQLGKHRMVALLFTCSMVFLNKQIFTQMSFYQQHFIRNALICSAGTPPAVLSASNPAMGGGIIGYGESPPTASISSASMATGSLKSVIACIVLVLPFITGSVGYSIQIRPQIRRVQRCIYIYKFWVVQFFISEEFLVPFLFCVS